MIREVFPVSLMLLLFLFKHFLLLVRLKPPSGSCCAFSDICAFRSVFNCDTLNYLPIYEDACQIPDSSFAG